MKAPSGRHDQRRWISVRTQTRLMSGALLADIAAAALLSLWLVGGVTPAGLRDVWQNWLNGAAHPGLTMKAPGMVIAAAALGILVVLGGLQIWLVLWLMGVRNRRRTGKGLATRKEAEASVGEGKVRQAAERSFPSRSAQEIANAPITSLGLLLGTLCGSSQQVVVGFNDLVAIYGPSGAGKSTGLMTPAALEAPGALIMTSNEVEVLDEIVATRSKVGKVWVFDPLGRSHHPEEMVWDPTRGCRTGSQALGRGSAFVAGCSADGSDATNSGFFKANSGIALRALLHAAALDNRDIEDVLEWALELDNGALKPREIIGKSTDPRAEKRWADMLASVATGADETVASTRTTLAQVIEPLLLQDVIRWVKPRDGVPVFDAEDFVRSTDTLVLLSDDSTATNVGPLCTMLFQEVVDAIKAYAPITEHGRLDPPLRIVGDEIANIAPVEKLPEMVTELRKLGVQVIVAFQSDKQPKRRWGEVRGEILQEQMSAEIVLPGIKSTSALNRFSELAGKTDVFQQSVSTDRDGDYSGGNGDMREMVVMRPDEVRRLEDGEALLIWRNMAALKINLVPWYDRDYGQQVQDAKALARTARRKIAADKRDRESQYDSGETVAVPERSAS